MMRSTCDGVGRSSGSFSAARWTLSTAVDPRLSSRAPAAGRCSRTKSKATKTRSETSSSAMGFPGRARATEEPEAHDDPTKNFAASPIGRSSAGYLTIVGRADIWPDSVQVPTGLLFLRLPTSGLPSCAQLPAERDAVGEECRPYGGPPESRAEHYCDFMVDRATPNLP